MKVDEIESCLAQLETDQSLTFQADMRLRALVAFVPDPATEAMPPTIRVRRMRAIEPARVYEVGLPGGWKFLDHWTAVMEVARFLNPPPLTASGPVERLTPLLPGFPVTGCQCAACESLRAPVRKPKPPEPSGRAILMQLKDDLERERNRAINERCDWAVDIARTVWPQADWSAQIDPGVSQYVPLLRWRLINDCAHKEIATDALLLLPAILNDELVLRRCIYRQRDLFFDDFKARMRECRKDDAVLDFNDGNGNFRLVDGRLFGSPTPADHLARAFALPAPHDGSLHSRLFTGPRAGMEDVRNVGA